MEQTNDLTQATQLLKRWSHGDDSALHALMPMVYDERRAAARSVCQRHDFDGPMQPTQLVHETYLRISKLDTSDWSGRPHFLAVAAKVVRQLVIDDARARKAVKRGGGERPLCLDTSVFNSRTPHMADVLSVEEALQNLARFDDRKARVVEMRFFCRHDQRRGVARSGHRAFHGVRRLDVCPCLAGGGTAGKVISG